MAATIVWLAAHFAAKHHMPVLGLIVNIFGLGLLSLAGYWISRYGVLSLSVMRSRATNLVATRGGADSRPFVWLVAHLDSKSQTIPMALRIASAVTFALIGAGVMASVLVLAMFGFPFQSTGFTNTAPFATAATILSYLAGVAALPIIFCFIGNRSPGALDNASGVASVILAAQTLGAGSNVGVLITSAEELGLAGARHFVATEVETGIAINCDTIDDDGKFICMASGAKISRLDQAIDRAASRLQMETVNAAAFSGSRMGPRMVRLREMIPGILADNIAFTDAGWESFTLSRGNIATLACVHTSRDVPDRIEGTGIAKAASLIAAIVQELS